MNDLRSILGIGGAGCAEVDIDPSRVQREEFDHAKVFAQVIWGPEGLTEMLGPSWYLVHDPRFLAIERHWAKEEAGRLGGVRRRGISIIDALDLNSKIKIIEDPELYSEMLAEGRHFRDVCIAQGIDPQTLHLNPEAVNNLIQSECPNYFRRNGTMNQPAIDLKDMLVLGLVALVDDYAELAYSQDWIRMDTGEVVEKGEEIWDRTSGLQVPIVAVEVDTTHKALVMRAQVRTTALRMMRGFPGVDWSEFENLRLTDSESDMLCQILFSADYDKLYTILPQIMHLIKNAQSIPYENREHTELAALSHAASDFHADLRSGKIQPIITPIEENPEAVADPGTFLLQLSDNPYLSCVFTTLQNLGARGEAEAEDLCARLMQGGGSDSLWGEADDWLLAKALHPKQNVFDGRLLLSRFQEDVLRGYLVKLDVQNPDYDVDDAAPATRTLTPEEVDKAVVAYTFSGCDNPMALALAVTRRGITASGPELASISLGIAQEIKPRSTTTVEGEYVPGQIPATGPIPVKAEVIDASFIGPPATIQA